MRYSDDIIEEVRMKNDIVDVISQYVKLTRKGSSYFGLCPFHNEKIPFLFRDADPSRCITALAAGQEETYTILSWNMRIILLVRRCHIWLTGQGVELPKIEYSREAREKADQRAAAS